jgi:hypothetical protein
MGVDFGRPLGCLLSGVKPTSQIHPVMSAYDPSATRAARDICAAVRRRDFIKVIDGSATAWPLAARAQEAGRVYRLGSLFYGPRTSPVYAAFFDGLRRYGFVEGQNLLPDPSGYGAGSRIRSCLGRVLIIVWGNVRFWG